MLLEYRKLLSAVSINSPIEEMGGSDLNCLQCIRIRNENKVRRSFDEFVQLFLNGEI